MLMEIQGALEKEETHAPAIVALGRTKLAQAVPMLTKGLQDADSIAQMFSAEALGEIGSPDSFVSLSLMSKNKEASVRGAAATSLGKIGDKKAIPVLEALLTDPEMIVELSAAEGLARYGKIRLDIYEKGLHHADYGVRHFAIGSLRKIGGKEAMPLLTKALSDPAPRVRIATVRAIGALAGPEAIPILQALLHDPDLSVRAYAAGNLGRWIKKGPNEKE
jgi:HEAT repeat protein